MPGSLALARRRKSSGGGKVRRSSSKAARLFSEDADTTGPPLNGARKPRAETQALGMYARGAAVVNVGSFEQRNDAATGPGFRREGLALQIDVEGQAFDGRVQLLMGLLLSRLEIGDLRPKRRKLGFLSGQLFGVLLSEGFFLLRALERLHVFAQPLLVFEDAANVSLF